MINYKITMSTKADYSPPFWVGKTFNLILAMLKKWQLPYCRKVIAASPKSNPNSPRSTK